MKSSVTDSRARAEPVPQVSLGRLRVSRMLIGGNPFSGFSHQGVARDAEMIRYYTTDHIKAVLREAEGLGINTFLGRADRHVARFLREYWDEGGRIQWFAQTASELASLEASINLAIASGAHAVYIHGGKMDWLHAAGELDQAAAGVEQIRRAGLTAGIAGHRPAVFAWAEARKLDVDFYMCSYYDPAPRTDNPMYDPTAGETYSTEDRDAMVAAIPTFSKPAIHYKVLAGGRTPPAEAFAFVRRHLRPEDAVCVGIYAGDKPGLIQEDLRLLLGPRRGKERTP